MFHIQFFFNLLIDDSGDNNFLINTNLLYTVLSYT